MKKLLAIPALCLVLLTACMPPISVQITYADTPTAPVTAPTIAPVIAPATAPARPRPTHSPSARNRPTAPAGAAATPAPTTAAVINPGQGKVPAFDHIVMILLENHGYSTVIDNPQMPNLNALAKQYVLLTQYYAIRHPSLPNYISLMSGDTYGITKDCIDCFLNQPNLADRIEAGGRTWRDYQEDMPSPCFIGNKDLYQQKHNPFLYFDDIRTNAARCENSVVPLTQLDVDLAANKPPNFSFIMPNMCNSGHDCPMDTVDQWLGMMVGKLQNSPALGKNSLIIIVFDEADGDNTTCCGLTKSAGGRIPAILISPLAKPSFTDSTPYSHFSMLKTILAAWGLPDLANTALPGTQPILEPWK